MTHDSYLTGITTTGTPHIGNYVGAIRPGIAASKDRSKKNYYFLADLHALAKAEDPERIHRSTLEIAAAWLALGAWTWLVGVVVSLGDIGTVSWTVWVTMLVLGILLPFTLMIECVTDLRTPFVIPGFVWVAVLLTLGVTIGTQEAITLLGLNTDPAWFPSSYPLVRRTLVTLALGFALVLAGTVIRGRARRRRELAARESVR